MKVRPGDSVNGPAQATEPATEETLSLSRRISWWALLAMVFLTPIVMSDYAFPGMDRLAFSSVGLVKLSVERILVLVALAAWGWDVLRRGGRIRRTPLDWLVLVWLAWVAVTTLTSVHWPTALLGTLGRYEGFVTFVMYALIYFLVLQYADDARRVHRLAQALFVSSLVVAVYGLLQFAGLVAMPQVFDAVGEIRTTATYNNAMILGGFLVFSVTVGLGLALHERKTLLRLGYWVGFGLNGLALVVTMTRGAWLGGVIGVVLVLVIALRQKTGLQRVDWLPAGVFLLAVIGIVWRSLSDPSEVTNIGKRLVSIFQFGSGSAQTRTEIWQAAVESIRQKPLLGWGADTFEYAFSRLKPVEYIRDAGEASRADNAHDYPLHLASGVGIIGAVLFTAIWVWAGVRSFKIVFARVDGRSGIILGAFWAAAAGYLVQLLVGISIPGVSFLLWIALAVVLAPTAHSVEVRQRRLGAVGAAALIVIAAAGIGLQGVALAADSAYTVASEEFSQRPYDEREEAAERAVRLNPLSPQHRSTLAVLYMENMAAHVRALKKAEASGQDPSQARAGLEHSFTGAESACLEAIAFTPDDYVNYVNLAIAYNTAGATLDQSFYQKTIETAGRGLEVRPLGTALRVQLADALSATGRTTEAVATLEYCMQIDAKGGSAALALARLYEQQGKSPDALALLKSVEAVAPGQPGMAAAIRALETGQPLP